MKNWKNENSHQTLFMHLLSAIFAVLARTLLARMARNNASEDTSNAIIWSETAAIPNNAHPTTDPFNSSTLVLCIRPFLTYPYSISTRRAILLSQESTPPPHPILFWWDALCFVCSQLPALYGHCLALTSCYGNNKHRKLNSSIEHHWLCLWHCNAYALSLTGGEINQKPLRAIQITFDNTIT